MCNPQSQFEIRAARPEEYDEIARVWMLGWQSTGLTHPKDLTYQQLKVRLRAYASTHWDLYIADMNGKVAGMLALVRAEAKLDQLFLHPDFQGQGIGQALLDYAKQELPKGMWLSTAIRNTRAIRFYERAGFVFDHIVPRPEWDRDDAIYRWGLKQSFPYSEFT